MRLLKHILPLLLIAGLLSLTACGNGDGTSAAQDGDGNATTESEQNSTQKGRYVETDVTPPVEGQLTSFLAADGSIVCFDEGLKTQYKSADQGKSWTTSPGPGANTGRYQNIRSSTMMADGSLLIYVQDEGLSIIAPSGDAKPFPIDEIDKAIAEGQNVFVSLLRSLTDDRFLLSYVAGGMMQVSQTSSQRVDTSETQESTSDNRAMSIPVNKTMLYNLTTGDMIAEIPVENATAATSDAANLYVLDSGRSIVTYSLADGKPTDRPTINLQQTQGAGGLDMQIMGLGVGGGTLAIDKNGKLYAMQNGSLLSTDANGDVSMVLESTAYSIGTPRSDVHAVFALDDGSIVVNVNGNARISHLYRYAWDDNATTDPNKTLTVWSLKDNAFVRATIAEIRKKHPDAHVTYEIALAEDNAVSAADAIKTLNTRLLNGSGPDVLILDGCPEESYVSKGMLLELGDLIDTGDVYDNLLAPYNADGKLYCLPTQFMMPTLMGDADALSKAQTLDDLVQLVVNSNDAPAGMTGPDAFASLPEGERPALSFDDLKELHNVLWPSGIPAIVVDNELKPEALRNYLTALKAINDKYNLSQPKQGDAAGMVVAFSDGGGSPIQLSTSLMHYTSQRANYAAFIMNNLQLMQITMERTGSELKPLPGWAAGIWQPSTVAAICADTKFKDFAAEFMQTMLSAEVQQFNYGAGLPVTRSGVAIQMDRINQQSAENDLDSFDFDADGLIAQLQTPSKSDTALTDMMWDDIEKCCNGETDVEGAVKAIEQNIKNYLAERK